MVLAGRAFYRVGQIFREMRHLMRENEDLKRSSLGKPGDEIEREAGTFAREFMINRSRARE
jgi:hypothetical protein